MDIQAVQKNLARVARVQCAAPQCAELAVGASRYCATHKKEARAQWRRKIQEEKRHREARESEYRIAWRRAMEAGEAAYNRAGNQPQAIKDGFTGELKGIIPDCFGWAYLIVKPGGCSFARWLVKQGIGSKRYHGGIVVSMGCSAPDVTKKEAKARAMADSLRQSIARLDPRAEFSTETALD